MKLQILLLGLLLVGVSADTLEADCQCEEDYFLSWTLDERRCLSTTGSHGIDACEEYNFDDTAGGSTPKGIVCTKCAPTHVIGKSGQCVPHELDHCIVATRTSDWPDYEFACTKCASGYAVNVHDDTCVEVGGNAIDNCVVHQRDSQADTWHCKECADTHYLNNAAPQLTCTVNPESIARCTAYEKDSEATGFICTACDSDETDNLLLGDGSECVSPDNSGSPLPGCATHFKASSGANYLCEVCTDTTNDILATNQSGCKTFPVIGEGGEEIMGYSVYKIAQEGITDFKCKTCEGDKVLQADLETCGDPASESDKHCSVWEQEEDWTCETCESSHPVMQDDETECHENPTEPLTVQPWWTENCAQWGHTNTQYRCDVCQQHYYLDTGKCVKTEIDVSNCKTYSDVYEYSVCEDRYTLNHNTCVPYPAKVYVAPTPVTCPTTPSPGTGNPTPGTGNPTPGTGNPTPGTGNPTPGNGSPTNTSGSILTLGFVALLVCLLL